MAANARLVKDYLKDWLPRHVVRHEAAHPKYPQPGEPGYSTLFSDWFDMLRTNNVTESEAEQASKMLLEDKEAAFRNNHPRLFLAYVEADRKAKLEAPAVLAGSREFAEAASRNCDECQGGGFATRVRRDGLPVLVTTKAGKDHHAPYLLAACTCPLGRWFLAAARTDDKPLDLKAVEAATVSYHDWYEQQPLPAPLDRRPRPTPTIKRIFDDTPFVP